MSDEAPTKPMLQTILKEMRAGFGSMNERLSSVERQLQTIETQLFNMDIRLDQIDGIASKAHSEVMFLRVDFKEFRARFKETA